MSLVYVTEATSLHLHVYLLILCLHPLVVCRGLDLALVRIAVEGVLSYWNLTQWCMRIAQHHLLVPIHLPEVTKVILLWMIGLMPKALVILFTGRNDFAYLWIELDSRVRADVSAVELHLVFSEHLVTAVAVLLVCTLGDSGCVIWVKRTLVYVSTRLSLRSLVLLVNFEVDKEPTTWGLLKTAVSVLSKRTMWLVNVMRVHKTVGAVLRRQLGKVIWGLLIVWVPLNIVQTSSSNIKLVAFLRIWFAFVARNACPCLDQITIPLSASLSLLYLWLWVNWRNKWCWSLNVCVFISVNGVEKAPFDSMTSQRRGKVEVFNVAPLNFLNGLVYLLILGRNDLRYPPRLLNTGSDSLSVDTGLCWYRGGVILESSLISTLRNFIELGPVIPWAVKQVWTQFKSFYLLYWLFGILYNSQVSILVHEALSALKAFEELWSILRIFRRLICYTMVLPAAVIDGALVARQLRHVFSL